MKKAFTSIVLCLLLCLGIAGCANVPQEIVGVYELTSASGTVNGVTISTNSYAYYTIELTKGGKAIIRSKAAGIGGQEYEATASFTYKEGKLKVITKAGTASVTEVMDLSDGVITYITDTEGMSVTLILTKSTEQEK